MVQPQKIVPKPQVETLNNTSKPSGFSVPELVKIQAPNLNAQSLVGTFQPLMSQKSLDGSFAINSQFGRSETTGFGDQKKEIDRHGFRLDE